MKRKGLAALCLLALLAAGCTRQAEKPPEQSGDPVVVDNIRIDNYFVLGNNQQVFYKPPERIAVVGETQVEAVLELGLEDKIVAAIGSANQRKHMRKENAERFDRVPEVDRSHINVEYISSVHPDILVVEQCYFTQNRLRDTDYWNGRGIATYVPYNTNTPQKHIYPETVDKEMEYIEGLGRIFHREEKAAQIIQSVRSTAEEIRRRTENEPKKKVMFIEFWSNIVSYDRTKLAGDIAAQIGAEVPVTEPVISYEKLIAEDPDVLFVVCSHNDYGDCIKDITENPALQQLRCVKEGHVYSVPLRYTYSTLVRTDDSMRYMAQCIWPDIFPWVDSPQ